MRRLHLLILLAAVWPQFGWGHASARLHHADVFRAFAGYECRTFREVVRLVSDGMDNELPRRFRREIGSVPGNHRLLGHCWTFGDAIPHRVFEAIEARHPGKSDAFVELWKSYNAEVVNEVGRHTGLSRRPAQALAALIHDVHLLGDRTPDNKLVAHVLTTQEICRNVEKEMRILWPTDDAYLHATHERFAAILQTKRQEGERAGELLKAIADLHWGKRLNGIPKS